MKKEDLTDEAIDGVKQFLSQRDVSKYQPMTKEQFEYIKLRFMTIEPDLNREMFRRLGMPFIGDMSFEEYLVSIGQASLGKPRRNNSKKRTK